ncbi:hypothetical protein EBZ37_12280 [bacterium]|nr:hypothetical protein [bacterium]
MNSANTEVLIPAICRLENAEITPVLKRRTEAVPKAPICVDERPSMAPEVKEESLEIAKA